MDPIFDRLGRLIRSFGVDTPSRSEEPRSSDPFQQEAEEELEEFLRSGTSTPKRPSSQGHRTYQEHRRQEAGGSGEASPARPLDPALARAYAALELPTTATWEEINSAHRTLLKKHHPDRHAGHEANMRKATAQSQKINEAYQVLKKHLGR